jgi:hypothetical protein
LIGKIEDGLRGGIPRKKHTSSPTRAIRTMRAELTVHPDMAAMADLAACLDHGGSG